MHTSTIKNCTINDKYANQASPITTVIKFTRRKKMKLKYVNFLNLSSQCGGQHKCPLASKYSSSCVCNYLYFSLLKPHNITDNNDNNIKNNKVNGLNLLFYLLE